MTKSWDGRRWLIPDAGLDEMELIGTRTFTVGVPARADPEFKAYILAAGSAHTFGNRSIDNILRKHYSRWVERFEKQAEVDETSLVGLRRAILAEVSARCGIISNLKFDEHTSSGLVAAANVLIRMESAFRAASHLLQLGFAFECDAVIRLGIEQVAWSNVARHLSEHEDVERLSGTGHITKLKSVFPGAGKVYNRLSDLAHVAPTTHSRFKEEREGGVMIRIRSPVAAEESMKLILILLDAFLVVGEECFASVGMTCENVDPISHCVQENRAARALIKKFEPVLPAMTAAYFDAWWR